MGCGSVSDFGHVPAILQTDGLELVSLYDIDRDRVEGMASKFGGIRAYTNQEEFLQSGLEGVVVASPATAHHDNVLAAARAGVHVLCEKPIAMTDAEAQQMMAAMKAANRLLLVGFVYRFSPVALQIRDWVRSGVIGEVKSLRLIYIWDLHGQYEPTAGGKWIERHLWKGRMLEGGPMVDCGVHQIDLTRWWLQDEVAQFDGHGAWVSNYDAPDHVYLHMDMERGAHSMVEISFTYGHTAREPRSEFSYHLIGSGGVIRYDRDGYILEAREGQGTIRVPGASEKNFPGMHAEFAKALRSGEPGNLPLAEDGLIATKIARAATEIAMAKRLHRTAMPPEDVELVEVH